MRSNKTSSCSVPIAQMIDEVSLRHARPIVCRTSATQADRSRYGVLLSDGLRGNEDEEGSVLESAGSLFCSRRCVGSSPSLAWGSSMDTRR